MNNYPDCLISAIKGLQNDYKINEIITEFFKENSESELKKKLNLLEKKISKDIIFDYLFNYEKYHSSNTINSIKQKSFASQSKINNIENNKVFDSNKNINTEYDDSFSILKKEKKVKYIRKEQDFLNKKKKREFNNENKSTEKKQLENKNKSKKKNKNKNKTKKLKENSINNYIIDNYINIKKPINKNKDYDYMSNNEGKESDKEKEQNSFLDFYLNEDLNNQNNNENYEENENVNLENESKEEQNNNLEKNKITI